MDHEHFDTLARRLGSDLRRSRRAAIGSLLAATLLRHDLGTALAKPKGKTRATTTDQCFPGTRCTPGKGKNTSGCDFSHSTLFQNKDVRGANLSNGNFFAADLIGADLRGANLSGGCFISADLRGARLGSSVNLHKAIFCNTRMPDGSFDDSGCNGETACCHLRLQDCPDTTIDCFGVDAFGSCSTVVGTLPSVGTCYKNAVCCPCAHPDRGYWIDLCNKTFPACGGQCTAQDHMFELISCMSCGEGP